VSQLHLSRRSAAVGLGALALVLAAGPAFAIDPASTLDKPPAQLSAPLEPVLNAVAPVVEPVVKAAAPAAPAAAPRPAAVTDPVTAIVDAVVKQVDKITAAPKAPAPTAPVPQAGPSSTVASVTAPVAQAPAAAAPVEVRGNALTAAAIELGSRADAGDIAAPLAFSPLGGLARGMAAGLPPLASATTDFSPTLALPGVSPQPAVAQNILPASSSPAGPTSLPGVLVALAVMAVAVTAAGHVSEAQRRRPATTA
jgi:hypothetical protein